VQNLFDSAITSGGITALVLCLVLPEPKVQGSDASVELELEEHAIETKV
jgi:xanthine permease XanP